MYERDRVIGGERRRFQHSPGHHSISPYDEKLDWTELALMISSDDDDDDLGDGILHLDLPLHQTLTHSFLRKQAKSHNHETVWNLNGWLKSRLDPKRAKAKDIHSNQDDDDYNDSNHDCGGGGGFCLIDLHERHEKKLSKGDLDTCQIITIISMMLIL